MFLASALCAFAQTEDASKYFNGKAWGFATVADESGTAYNLDGGMRASQPKTIILTSNGGDNADAITNAIANYDIIVLDGSKGKFTISAQMTIQNAKHKTIVGRNNAILATEFYLTSDDITYLKAQGLEGMSSTDQYTGTLPDGTKVTCDRRAFFTKKAMMELSFKKSGVYALPNKAGIFRVCESCENLIFRNMTFEGPGAVDIDGYDLFYNEYAKHLWVDHCTFIDAQDGALDTRGDYCTYTWNEFHYTSRSYSHAYTCGIGWVSNHSTVLHLTWGCNEWGTGCERRLPQGDDCFLHLVNNYHNCPGNSVGMTINSYSKALVEGNYAATGVKSPLTGSGENRKIYARDNSFSYSSTSTSIDIPYQYNKFEYSKVPSIVAGTHGAGATLDDFMPGEKREIGAETFGFYETSTATLAGNTASLPIKNLLGANYTLTSSNNSIVSIKDNNQIQALAAGTCTVTANVNDNYYGTFSATITVNVTSPSSFETLKKWDFSSRSSTTTSDLSADANWSASGSNYTYTKLLSSEEMKANGKTIAEAEGLIFSGQENSIVYYSNSLRLNKNTDAITITSLKKDDKLIVKWKSANSSENRGFTCTNLSETQILTNGTIATKEMSVLNDGQATITSTGGIYLYSIEVKRQSTTEINVLQAGKNVKTTQRYNMMGQKVGHNAKGIIIENNKKILVK